MDKASGAVCILPTGRTKAGDQVSEIFREMQVRSRWTPDQMAELFRQMDTDGNGAASLLPACCRPSSAAAPQPGSAAARQPGLRGRPRRVLARSTHVRGAPAPL